MAFGLFFSFILFPLTVILLITWAVTRKNLFGKILGFIWLGITVISIASGITQKLNAKILLEKKDFYGHYIIDKSFYPGKQAEWQYMHFQFDIRNNDSIFFNVTNGKNILKTYKGSITTIKPYSSERLIINMEQFTHHILTSNPTIYRNKRSFYLVLNSPKFGNVFFRKEY